MADAPPPTMAADPATASGRIVRSPVGTAALRLLGAGIIAYLFVVVLMTTTAQSAAVAQLGKTGYSVAYGDWQTARILHDGFDPAELTAAQQAAGDADLAYRQAQEVFAGAAAPVRDALESLNGARACGAPAPATLDKATAAAAIDLLKQCAASAAPLPDDVQAQMHAAIAAGPALAASSAVMTRTDAAAERTAMLLKRVQARVAAIAASDAGTKSERDAFASLAVVSRQVWLVGWLSVLPPAMMQIVSALVSGMFGALLLTLVLVVYPNTALDFTRPGGNYGERILLGGLIALCVLIVLGGGTAVLGTDNAFAQGTANVQAFSAIGVLAGMFSDRVAQWLSARATTFFGDGTVKAVPAAAEGTR